MGVHRSTHISLIRIIFLIKNVFGKVFRFERNDVGSTPTALIGCMSVWAKRTKAVLVKSLFNLTCNTGMRLRFLWASLVRKDDTYPEFIICRKPLTASQPDNNGTMWVQVPPHSL